MDNLSPQSKRVPDRASVALISVGVLIPEESRTQKNTFVHFHFMFGLVLQPHQAVPRGLTSGSRLREPFAMLRTE